MTGFHVPPDAFKQETWTLRNDHEGLLAHDYIHWLSHPNFYPKHYKKGGGCPFQVEGCTELFRKSARPGLIDAGWTPQFHYWRRPEYPEDGGENVRD